MDYFEGIIKTLLEHQSYWVRQSFKVCLTRAEKRRIGKPSMPRPEIDLLAHKSGSKEVLALEVKSLLDSFGVNIKELTVRHKVPEGRYKLFTCRTYRSILTRALKRDLVKSGMVGSAVQIKFGLVAGKVYRDRSDVIGDFMESKGWFFWSPDNVRQMVAELAAEGYDNDPAIITAKILLRDRRSAMRPAVVTSTGG